ncbi:hypothetical protein RchiOBHm_Chr4g0386231 [Rosa chinensis]|uniref:Uncharacterized protein n=1 Tax=Rosa chinensis TaxID=74649 RepID=A0A2P6QP43_ROSCH|nr:hypothetical protein RchiOBHm_Chr4g0386231 [Rosa chinensis]
MNKELKKQLYILQSSSKGHLLFLFLASSTLQHQLTFLALCCCKAGFYSQGPKKCQQ